MSMPVPELPIPPGVDAVPDTEPAGAFAPRASTPHTAREAGLELGSELDLDAELAKLEGESAAALAEALKRLDRDRAAAAKLAREEAIDDCRLAWLRLHRACMGLKPARVGVDQSAEQIRAGVDECNQALSVLLANADVVGVK